LEEFDQDDKDFIKIEVIDIFITEGAYIDRELNKKCGVQKAKENNNYKIYMPNLFARLPGYISLNVSLILRIKSKLKINIVSQEGDQMISTENYNKKEVHFMVIESELEKFGPKFKEF
jgi:hypothetical protein